MNQKDLQIYLIFIIAFTFGSLISFPLFNNLFANNKRNHRLRTFENIPASGSTPKSLYESNLADKLFNEVKILCWVFTHPANHKTKVPVVRKTWGRKCNKLLFMSVEADPEQPDIIAIPIENGKQHFWNKTKLVMKYVHDNYLNDFDWFMKADDDNFIIMENLRHMLYQHNPKTALYIGCRYTTNPIYPGVEEGFHAGGGHIFSKKALKKFINLLENNPKNCRQEDEEHDDVYEGKCLKYNALFIYDNDHLGQKRFFPIHINAHLTKTISASWYWDMLWKNTTQGSLECCSDTFVLDHHVTPNEIKFLNLLTYHVHPFGIEKNLTETLPRKFTFDEVVKMSDEKSASKYYTEHKIEHHFDPDEYY